MASNLIAMASNLRADWVTSLDFVKKLCKDPQWISIRRVGDCAQFVGAFRSPVVSLIETGQTLMIQYPRPQGLNGLRFTA